MQALALAIAISLALTTTTTTAASPKLVKCSAPRDLTQGSGTVRTCEVSR